MLMDLQRPSRGPKVFGVMLMEGLWCHTHGSLEAIERPQGLWCHACGTFRGQEDGTSYSSFRGQRGFLPHAHGPLEDRGRCGHAFRPLMNLGVLPVALRISGRCWSFLWKFRGHALQEPLRHALITNISTNAPLHHAHGPFKCPSHREHDPLIGSYHLLKGLLNQLIKYMGLSNVHRIVSRDH